MDRDPGWAGLRVPSPRKEPCRLGGAASQGLPPGWLAWRELLGLSWQGGLELPSGGAVPHTYGGTGAGCSPLCLNYGVRPMGTTTPSMPWSQAVGMGGQCGMLGVVVCTPRAALLWLFHTKNCPGAGSSLSHALCLLPSDWLSPGPVTRTLPSSGVSVLRCFVPCKALGTGPCWQTGHRARWTLA